MSLATLIQPGGDRGPAGPPGPAGTSAQLVYSQSETLTTITDSSNHILASVTINVLAGQTVKVTLSACLEHSTSGAGAHVALKEASTLLFPPRFADWLVNQTTEDQAFAVVFILTPAAGSHTYNFTVNQAKTVGTLSISHAALLVEIYGP